MFLKIMKISLECTRPQSKQQIQHTVMVAIKFCPHEIIPVIILLLTYKYME